MTGKTDMPITQWLLPFVKMVASPNRQRNVLDAIERSGAIYDHEKSFRFFHSQQKAHSNHIAKRVAIAPRLGGLENTRQLPNFERSGRSCRFFQPVFPELIFVPFATRRCFSQTESSAGSFLVFALASPNRVEKAWFKTRGFTSCLCFSRVRVQRAGRTIKSQGKCRGRL